MPDYGHPLRFGVFITPVNQPADTPVQLARIADRLGYDLATFQDHPYQAAFHDTWTLMTWVAASTERIHVSANVHNMQLRDPAILARSAASLDLLSGGRVELGIGAGGFADAVRSIGGPGWQPGEAVAALEEAIPIIRGMWDAAERRLLRLAGAYHSVDGAKRGPAPAHEIPLWIGALKPRMLRLIGRLGDGWLPSWGYMQPGDYARGNAVIDAAATEAGRDPREIRRLVNIGGRISPRGGGFLAGPADQWVDDLLPLALEDGISTFILASDDPSLMQAFIEEVAPELRERVAAERAATGTSTGLVRSAAALAKRAPGIDYDALPPELAEVSIEPGDVRHGRVSANYLRGGAPGLVIQARTVAHVQSALAFARAHRDVPFGVRSAGHGISGRSTNRGGIVLDVGALNEVTVLDEERRLVRVGPGAHWGDVAAALAPRGWAITSGDYGGVGVGGLATAGGVGWLAREHGLTIDHLRAAEVVLADGSLVRASAEENPELFWALRGAGANFGVVVAFELEADEVGEVGWAQLAVDASDVAGFLERWGAAVEAAPRILTSSLILGGRRPGQPRVGQIMALVDSSDPDEIIAALQPLAEAAPLLDQSVVLTSYAQVMANSSGEPHAAQGEPHSRSALVPHLSREVAEWAAGLLEAGDSYFFQIRAVGGAVADVPPEATAYAHRSASFSIVAMAAPGSHLDERWAEAAPLLDGMYLSFDTTVGPETVAAAFPPAHLARLRALKRELDPTNLFRDNFNIEP